MSVSAFPRLVFSWDRLLEGCRRSGDGGAFIEALDAAEPWLRDYRPPGWNASWRAGAEASDIYDAMRPALDDELRNALDRLFSFFWTGTTPPRDSRLPESETFPIGVSPAAVKSFVQLADLIELASLRPAYLGVADSLQEAGWLDTFDAFVAYVRQWIDLLREAAAHDAGIVVTVA